MLKTQMEQWFHRTSSLDSEYFNVISMVDRDKTMENCYRLGFVFYNNLEFF